MKIGPKEQQLRDLRENRPARSPVITKKEKTMKTSTKKTKPLPAPKVGAKRKTKEPVARKTAEAKEATPDEKPKGVRSGTKLETVISMLKRPQGCTTKEALEATGWPAISMPQQARAAGIELRKEKEGNATRYYAA